MYFRGKAKKARSGGCKEPFVSLLTFFSVSLEDLKIR